MEHFDRVARQLAELRPRAVVLHFAGEPLLHPELPRMVARARQSGAAVGLSSNGMLLTPSLAEELIEAHLDRLQVNFYPTAAELESLRPGASWERIRDNLLTLIEARRRASASWPQLRVQVMRTLDHAPRRGDSDQALRALLPLSASDQVVEFVAHRFTGSFAAARVDDARFGLHHRSRYRPCVHAWNEIGVLSDGRVVPCCRDLEAVEVLGHIDDQSLGALWNGSRYRHLRRMLVDERHGELDLCRHCTALWNGFTPAKRLASKMSERLSGIVDRRRR
jgi:radical SAM protein with 4Fe4S-binding SPASM domain